MQKTFASKSALYAVMVVVLATIVAMGATAGQAHAAQGFAAQSLNLVAATETSAETETVCPIEPGTYQLKSALGNEFALDVKSASKKAGANVLLGATKKSRASQQWVVKVDASGSCKLVNAKSGKVLGVKGTKAKNHANVQQQKSTSNDLQRWNIVRSGDGYALVSAADDRYALEVAGGEAQANANVRLAKVADADSQRFLFDEVEVLSQGSYRIRSQAATNLYVDVPECSTKSGKRLQVWEANSTIAQRVFLRRVGTSTYTIQAVCSGMYFTDKKGKVVQRPRSGKASQTWKAYPTASGIELVNEATGKRLALAGGEKASGTKLSTVKGSSKTTRFKFVKADLVPAGYYTISNAGGMMLDVTGCSLDDGANVEVWYSNGSVAQVFRIKPLSNGLYRITSDASGKALDVNEGSKANGANVQQWSVNKTAAQKWRITMRADGNLQFVCKASGKALEAAAGGKKAGANVRQAKVKASKAAQGWSLTPTTSQRISGNYELDSYLRTIVGENNYSLRGCFNWVTSNIRWANALSDEVLPNGFISDKKSIRFALYALKNHRGDCYYYASAFEWLARACGYSANARAGQVTAYSGFAPHGWTEVYIDGKTYVCDPNLQVDIGGRYNWFKTTYEQAAVEYRL